jgi:hypothetical protein
MADQVDDTTTGADPAGEEAARVAEAAAAAGQPTVIVDDPEVTGGEEGEEVVSGAPAAEQPPVIETVDDDSVPVDDELQRVAKTLTDLSRRELERLHTAVEEAMRGKGSDAPSQGPTLSETASRLPVNEQKTAAVDAKTAVAPFDGVEVADVLSWKVRQKQDVEGNPTGPAYLRIVTRDGQKLTAVHG